MLTFIAYISISRPTMFLTVMLICISACHSSEVNMVSYFYGAVPKGEAETTFSHGEGHCESLYLGDTPCTLVLLDLVQVLRMQIWHMYTDPAHLTFALSFLAAHCLRSR